MSNSELRNVAEFNKSSAASAQAQAIEMGLPLAVIASAELGQHSSLAELNSLEDMLAQLNIPIISMIGSEAQVLAAVNLHLNPRLVCGSDDIKDEINLVVHPHEWPSAVLSVAEVAARQNAC